jgi:hypothetical protein
MHLFIALCIDPIQRDEAAAAMVTEPVLNHENLLHLFASALTN